MDVARNFAQIMNDLEFHREWEALLNRLAERFGEGLDLEAVLFLIGVQELGQGYRKFKKDEKMDLMHIAICRVLVPYGFYEYTGMDNDGWPHYSPTAELPHLGAKEQSRLMKEAVLDYFRTAELVN